MSISEGFWKFVIVFNLILTTIILWMVYSQSVYLSVLLENKPVAIAEHTSTTALVINPISGAMVTVSYKSIFAILLGIAVILALYFKLKKR
ncbi:MAG: hypothetical protein J7K83_01405 [Candidatus Aenigmarchaeota archaeon]|nr:hypothetical protein [Candidatus Aenigmarchaeota archaeon]